MNKILHSSPFQISKSKSVEVNADKMSARAVFATDSIDRVGAKLIVTGKR